MPSDPIEYLEKGQLVVNLLLKDVQTDNLDIELLVNLKELLDKSLNKVVDSGFVIKAYFQSETLDLLLFFFL